MKTQATDTGPSPIGKQSTSLADGRQRWQLGPLHHPVRGIMDALAALTSVAAGTWLVVHYQVPWTRRFALGIYVLSLVGLFTVSSLYHMVPWAARAKARMQRLDHTMIFVLVAGTYTPVVSVIFDGWLRVGFLCLVWGIALAGTLQKWLLPKIGHWFSFMTQTVQGWLALFLVVPLLQRFPVQALALAVFGGVLYTTGTIFLATHRPRLWPSVFSYHEAFHVLLIVAGSSHFILVARYIAPFGIAPSI